ncbi:class I SAM-dependent methyltransferase [Planomonospora sp. ID67723]|uniref:class I SAM-dependent methyltransferase n=1 Tax=Planomonospora sp. ID67723 TaxID=2738134 RepID=UPI0018C3ED60|nr:class I SAM-dependent methyltransferase [Planomonospora sp. ID67723]MBG0827862.1 class I SAM-dependent methyltransferase [Planomonospora sp. ID67723]
MKKVADPASRLVRLEDVLGCPDCHGPLSDSLECPGCGVSGSRNGAQLKFAGFSDTELRQDPLNHVKESVKQRFGSLYPLAISLLSPVYMSGSVRSFLRGFDLDRELVADLGCGTQRYDPRMLCVDGGSYANVDLIADLSRLPLRDGVLSGITSIAVLEHVPDPDAHIAEMWRVLAPGGRLFCYMPFIVPFHASPDDYQRYTKVGLERRFQRFEVLDVRVGCGPTSGLLWVLQEWLALALSFGSERLYRAFVPLMWLLSPLKILDVVMARHPAASVIASGFVIEARKPAVRESRLLA